MLGLFKTKQKMYLNFHQKLSICATSVRIPRDFWKHYSVSQIANINPYGVEVCFSYKFIILKERYSFFLLEFFPVMDEMPLT